MRMNRILALSLMAVLAFSSVAAFAGANNMGIAEKRDVKFFEPIKVGDTVLPAGEYVVRHSMDGDRHIMTFTSKDQKKVVTVKVTCTLKPLVKTAPSSEIGMTLNAANQPSLTYLIFKGDSAQHVF